MEERTGKAALKVPRPAEAAQALRECTESDALARQHAVCCIDPEIFGGTV